MEMTEQKDEKNKEKVLHINNHDNNKSENCININIASKLILKQWEHFYIFYSQWKFFFFLFWSFCF